MKCIEMVNMGVLPNGMEQRSEGKCSWLVAQCRRTWSEGDAQLTEADLQNPSMVGNVTQGFIAGGRSSLGLNKVFSDW